MYNRFIDDNNRKTADYIPALAQVDPKLFGAAIVTADGRTYKLRDVDHPFSIQSISKVFTLALAMEEIGSRELFKKIGGDAAGRPFVGSAELNQKLSEDRADAVTEILLQQCYISLTRMLAPGAMGESRQVGHDQTENGQAENRRVGSSGFAEQSIAGI